MGREEAPAVAVGRKGWKWRRDMGADVEWRCESGGGSGGERKDGREGVKKQEEKKKMKPWEEGEKHE